MLDVDKLLRRQRGPRRSGGRVEGGHLLAGPSVALRVVRRDGCVLDGIQRVSLLLCLKGCKFRLKVVIDHFFCGLLLKR